MVSNVAPDLEMTLRAVFFKLIFSNIFSNVAGFGFSKKRTCILEGIPKAEITALAPSEDPPMPRTKRVSQVDLIFCALFLRSEIFF